MSFGGDRNRACGDGNSCDDISDGMAPGWPGSSAESDFMLYDKCRQVYRRADCLAAQYVECKGEGRSPQVVNHAVAIVNSMICTGDT